ncbi:MAG: porin [Proteobacteria bacterium]|nr:porin [Pseudomonadota bacterium]MBU1641067.1 porin [Pseudomonadota bacterium]
MRKVISSAAIIVGVLMASQVQAADQSVEARIEAIEKKLEGTNGGNFIKAGKDKIDVTLYGQVNKAVMFATDGENDDVLFVDNDASSTRIGIKAKSKSMGDLSAGAQFEAEFQGNDSNKVTMAAPTYSASFAKRQMKVYVDHKKVGKLTVGHGSTATDGIAELDLSGTDLSGSSHIKISGESFLFWDNTNTAGDPGAYSSVKVGNVFNHLDGGRKDMVRYDSPELVGLTLSASSADTNYSDIALTYHKKLDPMEIKAGVGYAYEGAGADPRNRMSGSASVLFNFGLNFTVAAGNAEFDDTIPSRDDASYTYFKVGYKFDAFSFGTTAVSVDYGMYDDFKAEGDEGTVYGLQLVQKVKDINTEFYLGYRNMSLDRDSVTYANVDMEDIQTTMAGARFKF